MLFASSAETLQSKHVSLRGLARYGQTNSPMDTELITAYAYSSLQRAVLTNILADILARESEPSNGLQAFYNDVTSDLRETEFPPGDPDAEKVREQALILAKRFFQDAETLLLKRGKLQSRNLVL